MLKNLKGKLLKAKKSIVAFMAVSIAMIVTALPTFAASPEPSTLEIEFDTAQMFSWAQTMINAMMPVVYIIMGVALGFLIIRAFKTAFN